MGCQRRLVCLRTRPVFKGGGMLAIGEERGRANRTEVGCGVASEEVRT